MKDLKTFAVKVIGMTDEEAAALVDADGEIQENAFATLAEKDKERMKKVKESYKDDLTTKFNEGHAKAKKEERSKFEAEIKEGLGLDTNAQGLDLIKEAMSKGSEEDIKTHPDYIALEKKLQSEYIPKEDFEVVKGEFDGYKQQVEKNNVLSRVLSDAEQTFASLRPQLPKDPKRAANMKKLFFEQLKDYDYQIQSDGNHVIIKDGKRLENDNMNPVLFNDFIKEKTLSMFDVDEQSPKGNSGVEPQDTGGQSYKDKGEFLAAYSQEADRERRHAMWENAKKKGWV